MATEQKSLLKPMGMDLPPPLCNMSMADKRKPSFKGCLIIPVGFIICIGILFIFSLIQGPGSCHLILTNTTDRAVSDVKVKISRTEIMFGNLAPHASTSYFFTVKGDSGCQVDYALNGDRMMSTNVGYFTHGLHGTSVVSFLDNGRLSYRPMIIKMEEETSGLRE